MLTVITINLNNSAGLRKTLSNIKDLKSNSSKKIQLVVVDGMSKDSSKEVLKEYRNIIDNLVLEADTGIYDAMNKGIKIAKYKWLNFMNSGDIFVNFEKIVSILDEDKSSSVIYGDKIQEGEIYKAGDIKLLSSGLIHACHQSMYFNSSYKIEYFDKYKIYGDYNFVLDYYKKNNNFRYVPIAISETEPNGVGQSAIWLKRKEKFLIILKQMGTRGLIRSFFYKFYKGTR